MMTSYNEWKKRFQSKRWTSGLVKFLMFIFALTTIYGVGSGDSLCGYGGAIFFIFGVCYFVWKSVNDDKYVEKHHHGQFVTKLSQLYTRITNDTVAPSLLN